MSAGCDIGRSNSSITIILYIWASSVLGTVPLPMQLTVCQTFKNSLFFFKYSS